jgi:hypothetical protein
MARHNTEYTEAEKAMALMFLIDIYGDEITRDPHYTAALMDIYISGYRDGREQNER